PPGTSAAVRRVAPRGRASEPPTPQPPKGAPAARSKRSRRQYPRTGNRQASAVLPGSAQERKSKVSERLRQLTLKALANVGSRAKIHRLRSSGICAGL